MRFTLRQLEVFLAIAKHENISRAAQELAMSQSAASAALQELESRYGLSLFKRAAKRLRLNSQGEQLRASAEALLRHARAFEAELQNEEQPQQLRVGASFTIGNYLAAKTIAAFLQRHPECKVDLSVASTPEIVAKVLNFEVDIGLIEAEVRHDKLTLDPWREDQMAIFCAPEHPLARRPQLTDQDLLNTPWILREAKSGHRQTFDRAMQGLLPDMNIAMELTQNEAIKNAVKSGLGLSCLSDIAIEDELRHGTLTRLKHPSRRMNRFFYFLRRKDDNSIPAVSWWQELCRTIDI
jgi:DNA-binding transcriptional LysR family regulator